MADVPWKEAIIRILREFGVAMTRTEIAEAIVEKGLRKSVGATPAHTVASYISTSISSEGDSSPFIRVNRGEYALRELATAHGQSGEKLSRTESESEANGISAFGVYWSRVLVHWKNKPKLLGRQQIGATVVDMADQVGVYLLLDGREIIYVGRSLDRPLGQRLFEHTQDRLRARWDRFSWFGLRGVDDKGALTGDKSSIDTDALVRTLESVLIESLEPRQNRKRGDDFSGIEYIQAIDPKLKEKERLSVLEDLVEKVKSTD